MKISVLFYSTITSLVFFIKRFFVTRKKVEPSLYITHGQAFITRDRRQINDRTTIFRSQSSTIETCSGECYFNGVP